MTLVFRYLDNLPAIPAELLVDFLVQPQRENWRKSNYSRYNISSELAQWLRANIYATAQTHCQIITRDIEPHCDFRNYAINYIIDSGGDFVTTVFYHRPSEPLQRGYSAYKATEAELSVYQEHIIAVNRWHLINTHVLHSVKNITRPRQAITLGVLESNINIALD
jgi:hypothetical protein